MSFLNNYFQAMADEIRSITEKTDLMTPEQMISEIDVVYDKGREDYILKGSLQFSSDGPFTLKVNSPRWDGTLEYSVDEGNTWNTWNGSQLSGTATQPIYLRGIGNTVITGRTNAGYRWSFTGKYCTGNIETLLDYQTVVKGQHPTMASNCYSYMFYACPSLTTTFALPATTLTESCYSMMFYACSSLTTAPELPATALAKYCYGYMFAGCLLATAPKLPATTLAEQCYDHMFSNCTSLTTAPKLPATTLAEQCYEYMFEDCTSLKISTTQDSTYKYAYRIPTTGTGTTANGALYNMFGNTGGTFTDTPTINTTYYTDHQPI